MAETWEDEGAWGSAARVPVDQWFPVRTDTGEWELPGQAPTLARSAGMPDVTAPPVMGGTPDQAPLALGQVAGTMAPQIGPQPRLAQMARLSGQGLLPEQPSMWQSLARAVGQASPTGQAILQGYDQQQQQQLRNRLVQQQQQRQEEQDARQVTRDRFTTFVELSKVKSKSLRNLMFDRWATDLQARGEQVPPDFAEAFKKSGLEEGQQMAELLAPMFTAAGMDPTIAARMLQEGGDPAQLIEVAKLGQAAQKQKADEAEEARIAQRKQDYATLGGASGVAQPPATGTTTTPATTAPTAGQGTVPPVLDTAVTEATKLYPQVRPDLVHGIIRHESNYDVGAVSPKGAVGPMQLMPGTAKDMGVDPKDPAQNVRGGVRYYAQLLTKYGGNEALALAAYNWGPGNVDKVDGDLTKMPAETQAYIKNVLASAAPGGQRGPADTRQQVAGPGAPAPAVSAADQAKVSAMEQRIAWLDREIGAGMGSGRERTKSYVNEMQQERTRLITERDKLTERGSKERERLEEPQRALEKEKLLQPLKKELAQEQRALTPIDPKTQEVLANNKSVYRSIGKIEEYLREGTALPADFVNLVAQDAPGISAWLQSDPKNITGLAKQWETKFKAAAANDPRANRFLAALGNMRDLVIRERSGGSVTGNELDRAMGAFMGSLPNINQAFSLFAQNLANVKETVTDVLVTSGAAVRPLSGGKAMYGTLPKDIRDRIDYAERGEDYPKATMPAETKPPGTLPPAKEDLLKKYTR
jgi:soluble lytic murein transglycosylase-like protein